jgi:hydrogenase maturation protein HypF
MAVERRRLEIDIRGAVQGVGFRPFVYRRAIALGLGGRIVNTGSGVVLEAEGPAAALRALIDAIRNELPPHARVSSMGAVERPPLGQTDFTIGVSRGGDARDAEILPDLATCDDCLRELFDEGDRRYRYPFINCTQCGPRYSIIADIPYDRERTAMRRFAMCAACSAEYETPADRRFHAEPNACPACGPRLDLWDEHGRRMLTGDGALRAAVAALGEGRIVALKGLGGFHLLVDATDGGAVLRLRERKRRPSKPFAVMFSALDDIAASCRFSETEAALVTAAARPIVLLWRTGGAIAEEVAPGNPWLGAFLAYTPLHHVILRDLGTPVVATSGNLAGEPIAFDEIDARERLKGIADLFLVHDRPILRPVDDSVARVVCGRELLLRRARGYAPAPAAAGAFAAGILAVGGHLKATVAVSRGHDIIASQHLGDLETPQSRDLHVRTLDDTARLFAIEPRGVAHDLHPDYASRHLAGRFGRPMLGVQHHVAHVAACLAENGRRPPALGVAWDGTGYGPDGTIWGGEFLLVEKSRWRRFARLRTFRLAGGDAAIRDARRSALGLLYEAYGDRAFDMPGHARLIAVADSERRVMGEMLRNGVNAPRTSSVGRLFDGFAALAGLRRYTYEGQAAIEFEGAARDLVADRAYRFELRADRERPLLMLDWQPALEALLADLREGVSAAEISLAVHNGLAAAITETARRAGERSVALSGGCFQNARLTEAAVATLRGAGFEPLWHRHVPPNDGGLAVGQAAWAAWMAQPGEAPCA